MEEVGPAVPQPQHPGGLRSLWGAWQDPGLRGWPALAPRAEDSRFPSGLSAQRACPGWQRSQGGAAQPRATPMALVCESCLAWEPLLLSDTWSCSVTPAQARLCVFACCHWKRFLLSVYFDTTVGSTVRTLRHGPWRPPSAPRQTWGPRHAGTSDEVPLKAFDALHGCGLQTGCGLGRLQAIAFTGHLAKPSPLQPHNTPFSLWKLPGSSG